MGWSGSNSSSGSRPSKWPQLFKLVSPWCTSCLMQDVKNC